VYFFLYTGEEIHVLYHFYICVFPFVKIILCQEGSQTKEFTRYFTWSILQLHWLLGDFEWTLLDKTEKNGLPEKLASLKGQMYNMYIIWSYRNTGYLGR
jgi:hypothetical protein